MLLADLPFELLLLIVENSSQDGINALMRTCRWMYDALNPLLYKHNLEKRGGDGLVWASAYGEKDLVKRFLNLGADPGLQAVKMEEVMWFPPDIYPKDCDFNWKSHLVIVSGSTGKAKAVIKRTRFHLELTAGCNGGVMTPLEVAMRNDRVDIAEFLLDHDYRNGCIPRVSRTRAEAVTYRKQISMDRRKFWSKQDEVMMYPDRLEVRDRFTTALVNWAVDEARALLESYPIDVNLFESLHWSVRNGNAKMLELLLSHGACDFGPSANRNSVLRLAVQCDDLSLLRLLLRQPAVYTEEIDLLNNLGWGEHRQRILELLWSAVITGHLRILNPSRHLRDVMREELMIWKILLAHPGIKTEFKAWNRPRSILTLAVEYRRVDIMKLLLARSDVNVNHQNEDGETALHIAVRELDGRMVRLLVQDERVDLNIKTAEGLTPLALALFSDRRRNDYIVEKLLSSGRVDLNCQDRHGNALIFHAVQKKDQPLIDFLLAQPGIISNPVNHAGMTPAHVALVRGDKRLARLLRGNQRLSREIEGLLWDEFAFPGRDC